MKSVIAGLPKQSRLYKNAEITTSLEDLLLAMTEKILGINLCYP
jgi:hypothetical protein